MVDGAPVSSDTCPVRVDVADKAPPVVVRPNKGRGAVARRMIEEIIPVLKCFFEVNGEQDVSAMRKFNQGSVRKLRAT